MFTGIVEKSVRVIGVADGPFFRRITLASSWTDVKLGESIAVNGCCLTIADIGPHEIGFDVIAETLSKTNLGLLKAGDHVHVERAMMVGARIDGHFVQGHIDGTAVQLERVDSEREVRLVLQAPHALAKYLVPKGSVAIDGVSLTIAAVRGSIFELALIPTTLTMAALGKHDDGWAFNLETDVLSKTIIHWLEMREPDRKQG